MKWIHASSMDNLTVHDLYQILKLRQDIFIVEQNCVYEDIDNIDPVCEHLFLKDGNDVIAYARIVPAGTKFTEPSIGRIVVHNKYRKSGYGRDIVKKSLHILSQKNNTETVIIEAQRYLHAFYESLSFKKISDPYHVDGISHVKMIFHF